MSSSLVKVPFAEDLLPKVEAFDCGGEPWEREVSDWLKRSRGKGSALDDLDHGNQIWPYVTDAAELVGVGSLGVAEQRWPRTKDPKIAVSVIPMLGVDRRFWGQPPGPKEERYAARILLDLIVEAKKVETDRPVLALNVNVENVRAIAFYERFGFKELHKPFLDRETGRMNKRMAMLLKGPA